MEEAAGQVQRIEEQVQQLLKEYAVLQKENQRLLKENTRLSTDLLSMSEQVSKLQQKIDVTKITSPQMLESSKKDLEKRINIYIKEIDKCLELLHA